MTPAMKDRTASVTRPDGLKDREWPVCAIEYTREVYLQRISQISALEVSATMHV
jgi:hypothetical protein